MVAKVGDVVPVTPRVAPATDVLAWPASHPGQPLDKRPYPVLANCGRGEGTPWPAVNLWTFFGRGLRALGAFLREHQKEPPKMVQRLNS